MRLTRRYRFAASHRLHTPQLSAEQNRATYGKCNHRFGHGHNYVLEVSVQGPVDETTGLAVNLERLDGFVHQKVVRDFHHKNMNTQMEVFAVTPPTTENVAVEIRRRLAESWAEVFPGGKMRLEKIRLYETRKNIIEV